MGAQSSGPGNGAGAGPLSTTPGTSQAPARQNNPPDPGQEPSQGEKKTKKSKRERKMAVTIPTAARLVPGRRAMATVHPETTAILECLTTLLLSPLPRHKIRRHRRQSKVLLHRHRSRARLLQRPLSARNTTPEEMMARVCRRSGPSSSNETREIARTS